MTADGVEYLVADATEVQRAALAVGGVDDLLAPAERDRMRRYRRPQDRVASWAGHTLLRLLAMRWLGHERRRDGADLLLSRRCRECGGPHGKPTLAGVQLSLSRSASTVLVVASPADHPVGADVEQVPGAASAAAAAVRAQPSIPAQPVRPGGGVPEIGLRRWVGTEAALKVSGLGLAVEPSEVRIVSERAVGVARSSTAGWTAHAQAPAHPEVDGLRVAFPAVGPGLVAAVSRAEEAPLTAIGLHDLPVLAPEHPVGR